VTENTGRAGNGRSIVDADATHRTRSHHPAAVPAWPGEDFACTECQLSYLDIPVPDAIEAVRSVPAAVRAAIAAIPPEARTVRPRAHVWSATEYVCHLRDVYATYTIRLHRSRTEHQPVLEPMLNDLRAERFHYNERDTAAILDELTATVAGFCDEVTQMRAQDWDRLVSRTPAETRTARWLFRQAVHEGNHHLGDIHKVAAAVAHRSHTAVAPTTEPKGPYRPRTHLTCRDLAFIERVRLGHVASLAADGAPHLSPKGTLWAVDQHTLAFAHIHSDRTVENIQTDPRLAITVVDVFQRRGLIIKGTAHVVWSDTADAEFQHLAAAYRRCRGQLPQNVHAFVVIQVTTSEPVWSPSYDSEQSPESIERQWRAFYATPPAQSLDPSTAGVEDPCDMEGT
jgi:uncharacterized damage-inducible protein DinB/predicted pyridoxine 5'-phosphate oxidase superfamily flavin-nucleotide-binding protein